MPTLENYHQFIGRHWETGSLANYYAYRGVKAPHTNQPYSEAMFMGISGGIVMGYFNFSYEGYDPIMAILTRNTFNPWDTILTRLGVVQDLRQTAKIDKAIANLIDTLADGAPALIWADTFSLPYNGLDYDEGMWGMLPLIVYGYEPDADTVWIADRANVPLTTTCEELTASWGRVKKSKHRLMTLDYPDPDRLTSAVQKGIWDTIKLFTEKPPKGSKNNFGFAAYQRWANLLTKPGQKQSWAKVFPPGGKMIAGLTSAYDRIAIFGSDGIADAERNMYATFLDEASIILDQPDLAGIAAQFRTSGKAWQSLGQALLPDDVPALGRMRELMNRRHQLFIAEGNAALTKIREIDQELNTLKKSTANDFPLNDTVVTMLYETLHDHILSIHDLESKAVTDLQAVMG